jgi:hypothetical protein
LRTTAGRAYWRKTRSKRSEPHRRGTPT